MIVLSPVAQIRKFSLSSSLWPYPHQRVHFKYSPLSVEEIASYFKIFDNPLSWEKKLTSVYNCLSNIKGLNNMKSNNKLWNILTYLQKWYQNHFTLQILQKAEHQRKADENLYMTSNTLNTLTKLSCIQIPLHQNKVACQIMILSQLNLDYIPLHHSLRLITDQGSYINILSNFFFQTPAW